MAQTASRPDLAYLTAQATLPVPAEIALRVAVAFAKWSQRARTRRQLIALDDHLLRDVGLDRRTAQDEARRMFWQG